MLIFASPSISVRTWRVESRVSGLQIGAQKFDTISTSVGKNLPIAFLVLGIPCSTSTPNPPYHLQTVSLKTLGSELPRENWKYFRLFVFGIGVLWTFMCLETCPDAKLLWEWFVLSLGAILNLVIFYEKTKQRNPWQTGGKIIHMQIMIYVGQHLKTSLVGDSHDSCNYRRVSHVENF